MGGLRHRLARADAEARCEAEAADATFLCEDCADLPPCAHCGQPTTFRADLPDGPTPVCLTCQRAGEVDTCAGCGTVHWKKDLTRLYASANLYCVNCTPVTS